MSLPDPNYVTAAALRRQINASVAYPKVPAVDHYDLDDGDATHPIYIKFILPSTAATIGAATISWTNLPFRSTANLNPSSVGAGTAHSHASAAHTHTVLTDNNSGFVSSNLEAMTDSSGTFTYGLWVSVPPKDLVTFSTTPGATGNESSHTHSLTGSSAQAVTEAAAPSHVTGLAIDGQDYTAPLGGPWIGDVIELDISTIFPTARAQWHTVLLSLAGLGRVLSMLRIYYL